MATANDLVIKLTDNPEFLLNWFETNMVENDLSIPDYFKGICYFSKHNKEIWLPFDTRKNYREYWKTTLVWDGKNLESDITEFEEYCELIRQYAEQKTKDWKGYYIKNTKGAAELYEMVIYRAGVLYNYYLWGVPEERKLKAKVLLAGCWIVSRYAVKCARVTEKKIL